MQAEERNANLGKGHWDELGRHFSRKSFYYRDLCLAGEGRRKACSLSGWWLKVWHASCPSFFPPPSHTPSLPLPSFPSLPSFLPLWQVKSAGRSLFLSLTFSCLLGNNHTPSVNPSPRSLRLDFPSMAMVSHGNAEDVRLQPKASFSPQTIDMLKKAATFISFPSLLGGNPECSGHFIALAKVIFCCSLFPLLRGREWMGHYQSCQPSYPPSSPFTSSDLCNWGKQKYLLLGSAKICLRAESRQRMDS